MEPVIIAVGSNLGSRHSYVKKAGHYLGQLSSGEILKSSIWESEPVGPAKYTFLNAAVKITTGLKPGQLLKKLKNFEQQLGREKNSKRWGPRILDLDIITYGSLVIHEENLIIPHPEYSRRLFVLLPMMEIAEGWHDPVTGKAPGEYINSAPGMHINRTKLTW